MAANQLTLSLGNYPDGLNVIMFCVLNHFSCVWLLRPHGLQPSRLFCLWGFSRQEYWSGLPCPPPGDLPDPGTEPASLMCPALVGRFLTTNTTWQAHFASKQSENPRKRHWFSLNMHTPPLHVPRLTAVMQDHTSNSGGKLSIKASMSLPARAFRSRGIILQLSLPLPPWVND